MQLYERLSCQQMASFHSSLMWMPFKPFLYPACLFPLHDRLLLFLVVPPPEPQCRRIRYVLKLWAQLSYLPVLLFSALPSSLHISVTAPLRDDYQVEQDIIQRLCTCLQATFLLQVFVRTQFFLSIPHFYSQ